MPYILKTAALLCLRPANEVEIVEPCFYGGGSIRAGDEAFLWFSDNRRLAWSAEVRSVRPAGARRIGVTVRLIAQSYPDAPTLDDLIPWRNIRDGGSLAELSRKLYFHSQNKVARISSGETEFLRRYFDVAPSR